MAAMTRYSLMIIGGLLVLQAIITGVTATNTEAMDLCLLVDITDSRLDPSSQEGQENINQLRDFLSKIVRSLTVSEQDTRVAVVSMDGKGVINHYLDASQVKDNLITVIGQISYRAGNRILGNFLKYVREVAFNEDYGNRQGFPDVVVMVTGGQTISSGAQIEPSEAQAELLKEGGTTIYVLSVGNQQNEAELRTIASDPDSVYYLVSPDYGGLQTYATSIFSKSPPEGITDPSTGPKGKPMCEDKLDLVFALDDTNDALTPEANWDLTLEFVINILKLFKVENDQVRVGILTYSLFGREELFLQNTHQTSRAILETYIRDIFGFGGIERSIASGLQTAEEALFKVAEGDRPDVRNVLILLTAGPSETENEHVEENAKSLKSKNIDIYMVGVTENVNRTEIQRISSQPQRENVTFWMVPQYTSLTDYVQGVSKSICERGLETTIEKPTGCTGSRCSGNRSSSAAIIEMDLFLGFTLFITVCVNIMQ